MANTASGKNGTSELRRISISQVRNIKKMLDGLSEDGDIAKVKKAPDGLNGTPKFHIFYNEKRYFDVIFFSPKRIKPLNGAEVAKSYGWGLEIFLDKKCEMQKIKNLILDNIGVRKGGLAVEKIFHEDMLNLIACDKEVSQVIKSIRTSSYYEDTIKKIDRFFGLTKGGEVPVQIKSSIYGQKKHKKNHPDIPSIVYYIGFPQSSLKQKSLRICESYPNIKEHL